jgi:hypothetical protein
MRIPTETEFDTYGGGQDAQCAWKNFGGLSVDSAYRKFLELPEVYQEDFMFMGWVAFEFYFPVIEKYLLQVEPMDESDDCESWILGCGIENQISANEKRISKAFRECLKNLCLMVIDKFSTSILSKKEKDRILKQWNKTKDKLELTSQSTQCR